MGFPNRNTLIQEALSLATKRVKSVPLDLDYNAPTLELQTFAKDILTRRYEPRSKPDDGKTTQLDVLMNSFESGQLLFTGPAGSGKTTLLHRTIEDIIEKKYKNLRTVELVLFVDCRIQNSGRNGGISGRDLIFHQIQSKMSVEKSSEIINYVEANPAKILFVIDSLDSLEYRLEHSDDEVKYETAGSPAKHLGNFLAGKYLQGCRILTTSREYSVRHLDPDIQPKTAVALTGLTKDSIRRIIFCRFEKARAENIWKCFVDSPTLLPLCSSPACLLYALCGVQCFEKQQVVTFTNIITEVMEKLHTSLATKNAVTFRALEQLSFNGLENHRTVFPKEDIEDVGLRESILEDVSIPTPWSGKMKFIRKDGGYLFTHKCLQEFFSALRIAKMPLPKFTNFIKEHFKKHHYTMVRRFLYGLLFSEKTNIPFCTIQDEVEKRQALLGNLTSLLRRRDDKTPSADVLEAFYCLYESGTAARDAIRSSLESIELENLTLSSSDALVIASAIQLSLKLKNLSFGNCSVSTEILQTLENCLKGKNVKISTLNIISNGEITPEGMETIGRLANILKLKAVTLHNSGVSAQQLKALTKTLREIKNFVVYEVREATHEDVLAAIKLFPKVSIYLGLDLWSVSEQDKTIIQSSLDELHQANLQVNLLPDGLLSSRKKHASEKRCHQHAGCTRIHKEVEKRINAFSSSNPKPERFELAHIFLDAENATLLGNALLSRTKVSLLRLRGCLQENSLSRLSQCLSDGQLTNLETPEIHEVDVSCHPCWRNKDIKALLQILQICQTSVLDISSMKHAEEIDESIMDEKFSTKLRVLKCSRTSSLEKNKIALLAYIASYGNIEELHITECNLLSDTIDKIEQSFQRSSLKVLNISYNCQMSSKGYMAIGRLASSTSLRELILRDCDVNDEDLKSLAIGLNGNTKLCALDLAFNSELDDNAILNTVHLIHSSRIQKLSLVGCDLEIETLKTFEKLMVQHGATLRVLDLSDNFMDGEEWVDVLMAIKQHCGVEELRATNNGLTEQDIICYSVTEKKIDKNVE